MRRRDNGAGTWVLNLNQPSLELGTVKHARRSQHRIGVRWRGCPWDIQVGPADIRRRLQCSRRPIHDNVCPGSRRSQMGCIRIMVCDLLRIEDLVVNGKLIYATAPGAELVVASDGDSGRSTGNAGIAIDAILDKPDA